MSADKNCLRWQRALNTIIRKETSKPATLWRFVIIYILSTCGSGAAARLTSFIKYQLFYRVLNLWTDSGLLRASWTSGPKPSVQFYRVILYYDHKVAPQDCFMLDFKLHSVSYFISTFSNEFKFLKTTLKYLLLLSVDSLFKSIEKHHIIFWLSDTFCICSLSHMCLSVSLTSCSRALILIRFNHSSDGPFSPWTRSKMALQYNLFSPEIRVWALKPFHSTITSFVNYSFSSLSLQQSGWSSWSRYPEIFVANQYSNFFVTLG